MKPFRLPRPATPFAEPLDTDDEATNPSPRQSSYYEASPSISFDSFHDAISGHEPAAGALPRLSPGASWRPRSSTLSSSPLGSDFDVERAPRIRQVGTLSTSPAGSAYSEMSIAFGNTGFEAALREAQGLETTSLEYQNVTPVRGSVSFIPFRCSSTTPLQADTPQAPSADWNIVATPRSLTRKREQENLRLEYRASQIHDSDGDINRDEDATSDFATQTTITKTKLRTAIPAKDSAIWQDSVFCLCGCASHPTHGEMSVCVACDQWYHLRCVGVEHLNEHYKNKPFYCPRCMEIGVVGDAVAEGL